MISAKDIFIGERMREEREKNRLKKTLPTDGYLTVRKEQMIMHEQIAPKIIHQSRTRRREMPS